MLLNIYFLLHYCVFLMLFSQWLEIFLIYRLMFSRQIPSIMRAVNEIVLIRRVISS
ncbi:hypothetical protein JOE09_000688 [Pantoea coffeiphila]|nr:hypothetical protein [Pantoea coffeiphila]